MPDQFDTYKRLLRGDDVTMITDAIYSGYYKVARSRGAPKELLVIWNDDEGNLNCRFGDEVIDDINRIELLCGWGLKNPVSEADGRYWLEHRTWPGDVNMPTIGHNSGEDEQTVREQLRDVCDDAAQLTKAKTDAVDKAMADKAANTVDIIARLLKSAAQAKKDECTPRQDRARDLEAKAKELRAEVRDIQADFKQLEYIADQSREPLRSIYMTWQREQHLKGKEGAALYVGGQHGARKNYKPDADPLHPSTIAAREAAEKEEEFRREAIRKAEAERQAEIARQAEADRLAAEAEREAEIERRARERAQKIVESKEAAAAPDVLEKRSVAAGVGGDVQAGSSTQPAQSLDITGVELTDYVAAFRRYMSDPIIIARLQALALDELKRGETLIFARPVHDKVEAAQ